MHAVEMPGQTTEMKLLAGPPLVNLRCRLAYAALCPAVVPLTTPFIPSSTSEVYLGN